MYDRFNDRKPRDPSMESIVRCIVPSSHPQERIVSCSKHPYDWKLGYSKKTCAVADVPRDLDLGGWVARNGDVSVGDLRMVVG